MMMLMRRITRLAAVPRRTFTAGDAVNHRAILLGSSTTTNINNNNNSSIAKTRCFSDTVAGSRLFSVAAANKEAYAKETVPLGYRPKEVVLHQYEICSFCHIVRAFLDYYDIPYKIVEVKPEKMEMNHSEHKPVPILMVDGEQIVNSYERKDMIDKLAKKMHLDLTATSVDEHNEEKKWRLWVERQLVPILFINAYGSVSEAFELYDYVSTHVNLSFTERIKAKYVTSLGTYWSAIQWKYLFKKFIYKTSDERKILYEAAETWVDALKGREFLGGAKPNLTDIAMYGAVRPIRYSRTGKDMIEHTRIGEWYSNMENAVGTSSRIQPQILKIFIPYFGRVKVLME